jgi:hypothetical protein
MPTSNSFVVKNDCSINYTFGLGLRDVDRDKVLCYEFLKQLLQPRPYSFYLLLLMALQPLVGLGLLHDFVPLALVFALLSPSSDFHFLQVLLYLI